VPAKALQRAFDLDRQLRNIDAIFARVFGKRSTSRPAKRSLAQRSSKS
jgi:hypothetical protein